jgi:hypothetical protein
MFAFDPKRTFGDRICCFAKWFVNPIPPAVYPCCNYIVVDGVVLCLWVRRCDAAIS